MGITSPRTSQEARVHTHTKKYKQQSADIERSRSRKTDNDSHILFPFFSRKKTAKNPVVSSVSYHLMATPTDAAVCPSHTHTTATAIAS